MRFHAVTALARWLAPEPTPPPASATAPEEAEYNAARWCDYVERELLTAIIAGGPHGPVHPWPYG